MNEQWVDPIVEEIRAIRYEHAKQFNFDIDAIFEDLRKREEEEIKSGRPTISSEEIKRKYIVPDHRKRPGDHMLAIVKAVLEAVPFGGVVTSLISDYVPTSTERSIRETFECFSDRLRQMDDRIDQNSIDPDEFVELFKRSLWVATNTTRKEKLAAVAAILSNLFLRDGDSEKLRFDELDCFMRCIDSLSIAAIQLLGEARKQSTGERVNHMNLDFDGIASRVGDDEFTMLLLSELDGFHLLQVGPRPTLTYEGRPYSNYPIRLTPLGAKFVNRILSDPEFFASQATGKE